MLGFRGFHGQVATLILLAVDRESKESQRYLTIIDALFPPSPMPTLDALEAQIHGIEDLQAVVRTMKALAMVSIRQYEKACTSLTHYNATLELGFQGLLRQRHFSENPVDHLSLSPSSPDSDLVGVILFGSDHGLCGQFNEQLVTYALKQLQHRHIQPGQCLLAAVGARLIPYLEAANTPATTVFFAQFPCWYPLFNSRPPIGDRAMAFF